MGLSITELNTLLEYIKKYNSFVNMTELREQGRLTPKYVDFRFDTRECDVWEITFRNCVGRKNISANKDYIFRDSKDLPLRQQVYNWLNNKPIADSLDNQVCVCTQCRHIFQPQHFNTLHICPNCHTEGTVRPAMPGDGVMDAFCHKNLGGEA